MLPTESLRDRALSVLASRRTLAAILAVAALLRAAHVLALRRLPLFDRLIIDSEYYDAWARTIAAGDWMGGDGAFFFDPLYTYLLAVIYRLAGHDLLVVRLLQAGLGVATCALVAWIGTRVAGRAVGNLAALFVALYAPAIYQEGEVEKTALGMFLATASLALALREPLGARLAAGATLGLAALTRGNMLLLAPFGALYFLLEPDADGAVGVAGPAWLRRLRGRQGRGAALFLAGLFAVLLPVAWRNHHVSGEWILTTAGAGTNFYTGNNPANASGGYHSVPFVRPQSMHEEEDFRAEALRRTGRRLGSRELSAYWFGEALRHMRRDAGFALRVTWNKFVLFWSHAELADSWDMGFLARWSPVLGLPLLGMAWLLPLAAIGSVVLVPRSRQARLLAGYVAVYCASVVAFYVFSRYRLHVLPALAVFGAAGAAWLAGQVAERRWPRVGAALAAVVAVGLFSAYGARAIVGIVPDGELNSAVNLAGLHMEREEFGQAAALLRDALDRFPGRAAVLCRAGELGLRTGDWAGARDAYAECLRADSRYPDAWYHLGVALERLGEPARAASAYRSQIEAIPGHTLAAARLAALAAAR